MSDIEDDNYSISSSESNLSNNDSNFATKDKPLFNKEFLKNIEDDVIDDIDDEEEDVEDVDEIEDVVVDEIDKDDVIYDDEDDTDDTDDEDNDIGSINSDVENNEMKSKKLNANKTKVVFNSSGGGEDPLSKSLYESDDDSEYEDEHYLQKFNNEINKNYIMEFHPECISHNYDEIAALSKVTRDDFNIIIDPFHKTVPYLTKYEKTRVLGQRAKQIECGAKPLVKVPENIIDSYIIAELELQQKKIPFIIRRPIPSGGSEYWNLKDLENISF
jgi:DNA-directed RNA polymerase I, II, and III subunit RPABC2|uniref:DNA-directed RNA polymerase n=1 Tax=viral metagenome TaxID=1070528 RepID=A0A6C0DI32_9ZZZZ